MDLTVVDSEFLSKYFQLYRHSYRARYTIINLSNNNRTVLQADETITGLDFFLVEWAPQGNK